MGTLGGMGRRVLVVEDDDDLRAALVDVLAEGGHTVSTAGDGQAALEVLKTFHADLIVLDLMMPIMNGWQFRVAQRRDPVLAQTPVVAISASDSPVAAAVDADVYLKKPVGAEALLEAVDEVLHVREHARHAAKLAQTERMASLGTLAAGIAHEINNPLTFVLLHLARAEKLLPAVAPELGGAAAELRHMLGEVTDGVTRIRDIVAAVRTFSRVDDIGRTPVDLGRILDSSIQVVTTEIRHRARLVRDYRAAPRVLGNDGRLGQVFMNLLMNAAQAIPEGASDTNEIRVGVRTDAEGWAVVEITDSGRGIPARVLGRIFEPFFSTKPVGFGMGLGLSICRGIVTAMGGEIAATSEVGRGTTMTVRLPPAPPEISAGGASLKMVPAVPERRRRILVVDDEPALARAIASLLGEDHEVVVCVGGRPALELLEHDRRFDSVLCDLHMPEVSGMEVYERLKALGLGERTVFMSGGVFTSRVSDFLGTVKNVVLDKPLDFDKLRAAITKGT